MGIKDYQSGQVRADKWWNPFGVLVTLKDILFGVEVQVQDQHSEIVDLLLSRSIQTLSIAIDTALNDRSIVVMSLAEAVPGSLICLKEGTSFYQGTILTVVEKAVEKVGIVLTGSIDPTASINVVGVGTLFDTELLVGDSILVSGETRIVATIADDLNLTVTVAFTDVAEDLTPERLNRVLTGTLVSITGVDVVGNGTLFTTELLVGDSILVGGVVREVLTLTDATNLVVTVAFDDASLPWTILLDTPLDFAFTVLGGCSERSTNMNVDGSGTPIIFTVTPGNLQAGLKWDVVRFLLNILDAEPMDDGKFGGVDALTNGVVIRSVNGKTKNVFNAKTNGDFRLRAYDVEYVEKAPAGQNSVSLRRTFGGQSKNGVVIRLEADTLDEFQVIIQDDLEGLTQFKGCIQGHVVED